MNEIFDVLIDITVYASVVCIILYLKGFVVNNKAFKFFTLYLLAVALVQICMRIHGHLTDSAPNLHFFVYYFVSEFILLSLFYKQLLGYKVIYVITGCVLGFIAAQYIIDQSMYYRYNPIGSSITRIIIVCYSLLYLYKSLSHGKEFLIVNVGVFIYFLSSVLIFASGNLVFDAKFSDVIAQVLLDMNGVLYLVFQLLIIVEWYRNYRKPVTTVINS